MIFNLYWDCVSEASVLKDFSPASSTFDGLYIFNCNLLFLIISLVLFVWWLMFIVYFNFYTTLGAVILIISKLKHFLFNCCVYSISESFLNKNMSKSLFKVLKILNNKHTLHSSVRAFSTIPPVRRITDVSVATIRHLLYSEYKRDLLRETPWENLTTICGFVVERDTFMVWENQHVFNMGSSIRRWVKDSELIGRDKARQLFVLKYELKTLPGLITPALTDRSWSKAVNFNAIDYEGCYGFHLSLFGDVVRCGLVTLNPIAVFREFRDYRETQADLLWLNMWVFPTKDKGQLFRAIMKKVLEPYSITKAGDTARTMQYRLHKDQFNGDRIDALVANKIIEQLDKHAAKLKGVRAAPVEWADGYNKVRAALLWV